MIYNVLKPTETGGWKKVAKVRVDLFGVDAEGKIPDDVADVRQFTAQWGRFASHYNTAFQVTEDSSTVALAKVWENLRTAFRSDDGSDDIQFSV